MGLILSDALFAIHRLLRAYGYDRASMRFEVLEVIFYLILNFKTLICLKIFLITDKL